MRALRIWTDIVEWRWTPAVGLGLGALFYVSLALLVIPDRIGDEERKAGRSLGAFQSLRNRTTAFAASIAPSLTDSEAQRSEPPTPAPPPAATPPPPVEGETFPRRGFTPPLERVEPAPPPPPPPPPPTPEIVVQPPQPPPQPAPPQAEAPPPAAAPAPPAPPPEAATPPPNAQAQPVPPPAAPAAPEQPAAVPPPTPPPAPPQ